MERLIDGIPKKVFVCDGAPWIWDGVESVYPKSLQILDYYHVKHHLCARSICLPLTVSIRYFSINDEASSNTIVCPLWLEFLDLNLLATSLFEYQSFKSVFCIV